MDAYGAAALQYGVTEGIPGMRTWAAERLSNRRHEFSIRPNFDRHGLQQGLDLVGKFFWIPATTSCAKIPPIWERFKRSTHIRRGIFPSKPTRTASSRIRSSACSTRRSVSEVSLRHPNFQNPTGRTLSADRRERSCGSASASIFRSSKTTRTENSASRAKTCPRFRRSRRAVA